jgi:hypothetical protein
MSSLETLDVGANSALAWSNDAQDIFAASTVGGWGWVHLYNL